jgi:hypothetical protein
MGQLSAVGLCRRNPTSRVEEYGGLRERRQRRSAGRNPRSSPVQGWQPLESPYNMEEGAGYSKVNMPAWDKPMWDPIPLEILTG